MNNKNFKFWNRIVALLMLVVSAAVYLLTIEPTASFWDCGEFIASSYKLEVGHPPGNPVFQLFARFASMFGGPENAAIAVNALSAICSAFTIFFLYLTIVFFAKRLIRPSGNGEYSIAKAIAIFGSGAVGALTYTFTDTFWFSAVEGEVYAMSSLVTALVFWAMTKWYDQADQPHSSRWIVLISFIMGLSIGIHLLNLLAIPALVFMFFYKKRENGHYSMLEYIEIFLVSVVILAVVLYGVIPYLPRIAAYFDLFFVNTLGLPFNTGAAFFMLALLALCFWGIYRTMKAKKVLLNMILLCFTMIVIGFSMFSIVIIRSSAKTPTNEYQPDNPFTLIRYLGREQYGSNPLIYGQYFDSRYDLEETDYWAPMGDETGDRYIKAKGPAEAVYDKEDKMFFPRMWSSTPQHIDFYTTYMADDGLKSGSDGNTYRKPTFGENLKFFFDYQMNWMYWRYFMWNFVGRQNDIHSPTPGDPFAGNWESGISVIDNYRLGDQSDAPDYLKNNKGKNHYYMLPLLLGIIGIFFQFARDKRGSWLTFLMFFMTGIAIVVYLNQPPYQVRERDYAYAGSFYFFSAWIGFAVAAVYSWVSGLILHFVQDDRKGICDITIASAVTLLLLGVPTLMATENWDDHDRSNRYTAVEMAKNYLNSVGPNGILVTHGDNDTFPLWYAQEVEGVRTDVRIANTSLLGTDWHIDQMKWAMNDSAPLDLSLEEKHYLYGTNEFLYIWGTGADTIHIADLKKHLLSDKRLYSFEIETNGEIDEQVMAFEPDDPQLREIQKNTRRYGVRAIKDLGNYIPAHNLILPVNKENVIKYGILDEKYIDEIPSEIVLTIPKNKNYITKPELFMLDLLSNYQWDRPLNLLSMGGDINIGLKDYLMYEGFSYRFVPKKSRMKSSDIGFADPEDLYYKMKNVYSWDALKRTDYFVDYQNFYTFCGVLSQRNIFLNAAKEMMKIGEDEKAVEMLDMCQECVPEANYPLDIHCLGFSNEYMVLEMVRLYFALGEPEKAFAISQKLMDSFCDSWKFFSRYEVAKDDADQLVAYIGWLIETLQDEIGRMDIDKDKEKLLKYLELCRKGLELDDLNCEGWTYQVGSYAVAGAEDQVRAIAGRLIPLWLDNAERSLRDLSLIYGNLDALEQEYDSAYQEYEKALQEYKNEERNPQSSPAYNRIVKRVENAAAKVKEIKATHDEYSQLASDTKGNLYVLYDALNSVFAIIKRQGFDDIADKYDKRFLELQNAFETEQ